MKTLGSYVQDDVLLCPNPKCGHSSTHHDRIEVFDRVEDASKGRHVIVQNGDTPGWEDAPSVEQPRVTVDDNLTGNPSRRRGGILIHLWCEGCGERFRLAVSQHKGSTLLELLEGS